MGHGTPSSASEDKCYFATRKKLKDLCDVTERGRKQVLVTHKHMVKGFLQVERDEKEANKQTNKKRVNDVHAGYGNEEAHLVKEAKQDGGSERDDLTVRQNHDLLLIYDLSHTIAPSPHIIYDHANAKTNPKNIKESY